MLGFCSCQVAAVQGYLRSVAGTDKGHVQMACLATQHAVVSIKTGLHCSEIFLNGVTY